MQRDIQRGSETISAADQARMAFIYGLRERGISNLPVLRALETVPRELFVPHRYVDLAWKDIALPIACGQTMPQPDLLARILSALEIAPDHRILEIGSGSGYAAAVMSQIGAEVLTFERFRPLQAEASARLERLGFGNVRCVWGDGLDPRLIAREADGPWDRIIIHGSVAEIPPQLAAKLVPGGSILFARRPRGAPAVDVQGGIWIAQPPAQAAFLCPGHFTALTGGRSAG